MSVQFKFKDSVAEGRRREIIDMLGRAGYPARSLYPGQHRPSLASIFTVSQAEDVKSLHAALTGYKQDIEYVEASPKRGLKS
ncbi:MAG TPA: hypothetical protein VJT13_27715 [Xanthobacteraceae bacterium]|nr:hypothetical protein [Xanthobacteraceae bacterium]